MDHIVKKLSEIEHAAEAVVEHAELEKSELEERIQNERNQFDKQLEDHTQKELNDIHKGLNRYLSRTVSALSVRWMKFLQGRTVRTRQRSKNLKKILKRSIRHMPRKLSDVS